MDEGLLITIIVLRRAAIASIGKVPVVCGEVYCGAEGPAQGPAEGPAGL